MNVDPFTATGAGQRHAAYAALAVAGPVHRITLPGGEPAWLITGHEEVRQALNDPRIIKREATGAILTRGLLPTEVIAATSSHMLNSNGSDHTRLRRLVTAAFTRRRIEQLAPRIQQITDELLDTMTDTAQVELIEAFAYPLPITVICELLGVPAEDRDDFAAWSNTMVDESTRDQAMEAAGKLHGYLSQLIDAKRQTPDDALISALIQEADGGDRLSQSELVAMAMLLLIAGHETTVNLIGNGVLALLTHPEQLALVTQRPELMASAVEEFLRWDSPIHSTPARF
ncbi:MAG: cytochrome P450 family protein, partial [Pseudonocardiaceae bacterium]